MRISDWSSDVCSSDLPIAKTVVDQFEPVLPPTPDTAAFRPIETAQTSPDRKSPVTDQQQITTCIEIETIAEVSSTASNAEQSTASNAEQSVAAEAICQITVRDDHADEMTTVRDRSEERRVGKECDMKCRSR